MTLLAEPARPNLASTPESHAAPPHGHSETATQPQSKTAFTPVALTALASALLAACGGGGGGSSTSLRPGELASAPGFNNFPKASTDDQAARFLLQSQLAASDESIAAVRSASFAEYLQQQYNTPVAQTAWAWLEQRGYGQVDADDTNGPGFFFSEYPMDFVLWKELFTAPDAMRKRVALALSEFFVVSMQSMEVTWRGHVMAAWWDLLNRHAFGNFRALLEDVTLNIAMGYYLNTRGNQKEDNRGRQPDENYAREIMQLFTIGLYELNLDGSEKTDSNGKRIETYDSDDVSQLARIFTGYDIADVYRNKIKPSPGATYMIEDREYARQPMVLNFNRHSQLPVNFLNASIGSRTSASAATAGLKTALDTLFNHPNVGPFFVRQMIQRLVTSNPSPAYVARVASAFNNNGAGVRGDLKAVWTAILLDDEARNPDNTLSGSFGKVREPMLRFIQWGRSFGLTSAANSWKMFDFTNPGTQLGQSPLRAPSVFNFFRPGFIPPNTELASQKATAPEFQIINETTVGGYLNFMEGAIRRGFRVSEPTLPEVKYTPSVPDITPNYTRELALVTDAAALVRRLSLILCAGQLSAASQTVIVNALNQRPVVAADNADKKLDRVAAAVLLVMASAEYLVQK